MLLGQLPAELQNIKLIPDKVYEIEYVIPDKEIVDRPALQEKLKTIILNVMNSPDLQYVKSKLEANIFKMQIKVRPPKMETTMGILPLLAVAGYVLAGAVILALAGTGLKWAVKSIKEVVIPVKEVIGSILPIALIIGAIFVVPPLLKKS